MSLKELDLHPQNQANMWLEKARLGNVGGNTLGFHGAIWGPKAERLLAHGCVCKGGLFYTVLNPKSPLGIKAPFTSGIGAMPIVSNLIPCSLSAATLP